MNVPRLRGISVNNKTGVFYSPEDVTVGLVGMSVDGIYGYEPDYANDLMVNAVLFALGGPVPPKVVKTAAPAAPPPPAPPMEKKPEEKKPAPPKGKKTAK